MIWLPDGGHGLFGKEESLELPERARRALTALSEMRAMLEGIRVVAGDPTKPATFDDITQALGNVGELTRISEREIHEAVLSCGWSEWHNRARLDEPELRHGRADHMGDVRRY